MKNFAGVALPLAVASFVIFLPVGIVAGVMQFVMQAVMQDDPSLLGLVIGVMYLVIGVIMLGAGSFIAGGVAEFSLKVVRGQKPEFGEVFAGGKHFGAMLVGGLGYSVAVGIGSLLCIVPGYIVQFGLWPFAFVIVDQRLGGIDALKKAWQMTNGHKMSIFVFALLLILVAIAGELACFIGLLLVSYPMIFLASAHMYATLNGEQPRQPV